MENSHTFTIAFHGRPAGELAVQVEVGADGLDIPHLCQAAATQVCAMVNAYTKCADEDARPWAVAIKFGGEAEGRELNRDYRHKDYATNVLSFVAEEDMPEMDEWHVGDIFVCTPVLVREAAEMGKPLADHLQHLVVHGMLHLVGYDHELGEEDAERMEKLETEILAEMGLPDPYAQRDAE